MTYCHSIVSSLGGHSNYIENIIKIGEFEGKLSNIETIEGLKDWNTCNAIKMNRMLNGRCYLKNLKGLEKWNVSNVKKMSGMFYGELLLENLDEL